MSESAQIRVPRDVRWLSVGVLVVSAVLVLAAFAPVAKAIPLIGSFLTLVVSIVAIVIDQRGRWYAVVALVISLLLPIALLVWAMAIQLS